MCNNNAKGTIKVLGIDLAKQSFQLHGVDEKGNTVLKNQGVRVVDIAKPKCMI